MRPTETIPHQTAAVPVADGAVPILHREGGRAPGPALVVVPSIFGITDDLVPQLESLAADAGLLVVMDLFWRDLPGPVPYPEMATVLGRYERLDHARAYADWQAVVAWARAHPACDGRVVGLGICFGGPFTLVGAADGLLQGAVTWHGSRLDGYLERSAEMRCPMAHHFGERDRIVPTEAIEAVRAAFAGRDDVEIVVHPGADHGFTHPAAPTADPAAREASMASVRRLLREAR